MPGQPIRITSSGGFDGEHVRTSGPAPSVVVSEPSIVAPVPEVKVEEKPNETPTEILEEQGPNGTDEPADEPTDDTKAKGAKS